MREFVDRRVSSDAAGAGPVPARVVICGYYGFGNAGDELILGAMLAELRALRPGLAATVISGDPGSTRTSHGVEAVHWQDVSAIVASVRDADLVVVGGGGLFQEYSGIDPHSLFSSQHYAITYYAEPAILGALCGRPVMLYALGVGPLFSEHGRRTVRAACDAADVVTLRDEESVRIVASLGVDPDRLRLTADPAWALPGDGAASAAGAPGPVLPEGPGPLVAVCLRHWDVGVSPYFWERELAAGLDAFLAAHEARLLFVPFQRLARAPENDGAVAERVRSLLRRPERATVVPGDADPNALRAVLGRCDLVVGMRLHALILAALSGVPGVALSYDRKVDEAMRQVGAERFVVPLPDLDARTVAARMEQALAEGKARRGDLRERVGHLAALAGSNAVAAIELLDRGPRARPPGPVLSEVVTRAVTARYEVEAALRGEVSGLLEAKGRAEAVAAEREGARAALEADLVTRSEELRRVQEELGGRDAELRRAEEALTRRDAELRQVRADLAAQTAELEGSQDELTRQDEELARVRSALERQGEELEQARSNVARRDEELARFRAEAARLGDEVARVNDELLRIHQSRLWKLATRYWRFLERIGRLPRQEGRSG